MRPLPFSSPVPLMLGARDSLPSSYAPEQDPVYEVDLSRTRPVVAALKAIKFINPEEVAHLCAVLVGQVAASSWNCTQEGEMAQNVLSDLHDDLEGRL